MKMFCLHCEDNTKVVEKKIALKIGKATFSTKTLVCGKCKSYALTPKIREEMDKWGRDLSKSIAEPQPVFSEATHKFAEEMARKYGLSKVPLFRALTAFYLNKVVNREDFQDLAEFIRSHDSNNLLDGGKKSKVCVPVNYMLFKKLQTFTEVWKTTHAKAIEEAVIFGLSALSHEEANFQILAEIAKSLEGYITDYALVA
jgi:hypothetical protein